MTFYKPKNTVFFYLGILAGVLGVGMIIYYIADYNATFQGYIAAGYDKATVSAYMPFTQVIPSLSDVVTGYGIIAAVLFAANSLIKNLFFMPDMCECGDEECGCEDCCDDGCECDECKAESGAEESSEKTE